MKIKRAVLLISAVTVAAVFLGAQQGPTGTVIIRPGEIPTIAIPDMRGSGAAQSVMATFNSTLWNEVQQSGQFKMVGKSYYPTRVPQQPTDFRMPSPGFTEWTSAPVSTQWLAFGYTAPQDNQIVLRGWLYNVLQTDIASAQVIGKLYYGPMTEDGARKVAREFAADILATFGAKTLIGTKIYFSSDRSGGKNVKEVWSMDYDGTNQKQISRYNSTSTYPCVSPDGSKVAFMSYTGGLPKIYMYSTDTGRKLVFYNQALATQAPSDFTPDGKEILLYGNAGQLRYFQLFRTNIDGSNLRRITYTNSIEVEPKVNPKNPSELVFVSGRSGPAQIYRMNIDGADVVRLTDGTGEAVNPSWHPDGQRIAFAWTRGLEPGAHNIFVMDVATHNITQLTHGNGRNENPVWAPDGIHIVFSSKRGRNTQIYTMLANGNEVKQLTTQGNNEKPVWAKAANQ